MGSSEDQRSAIRTSDPTPVTVDVIRREVAHLSDRIDLKIEGVVSAFTARLDAIDKATSVFSEGLFRVPTQLQQAISAEHALTGEMFARIEGRFEDVAHQLGAVKELKAEQFKAIQQQFAERDTRTEQISKQSEVAINAALQAAKEAVAEQNRSSALAISKSEASTDKRIDQIGQSQANQTSALDAKINDIKDRLIIMEGRILGASSQQTETRQGTAANVGVIGLIVVVLSTIIGLAMRFVGR